MVTISIIIPTYKRKDSLLRLLVSIFSQMTTQTELIIVEQGLNHKTLIEKEAKKWKKPCIYIFAEHANMPKARNIGAMRAKGTYLVFYDDDVVLTKYALRNIVKGFEAPNVGMVGGRVTRPDLPDEKGRIDVGRISLLGDFTDGFSSIIRQEIDTVIGCNMAIRKDVFDEIHGFDGRFTGNSLREESDACLRVKERGYKVVFEPSSCVVHFHAAHGGASKLDNRLYWYYHFFHNETYFFLKHRPAVLLPLYLLKKYDYIFRCMFGIGREVSIKSLITPWKGIAGGVRSWKKTAPYIIGVDAGALAVKDDRLKVGVWRVTYELLRHLSQIDMKREYRLYSFAPIDGKIMDHFGRNMRNVVLSPSFGYMKFRLSLELFFHPVDTFFALSQALPTFIHGKKIAMVYDLAFRHGGGKEFSKKLEYQTHHVIRNAKHIITISDYVKEDIMKEYGIQEKNITTAYLGVNDDFTHVGKKMKRSRPYFLFVGSLRKGKNIPALIEAFHLFAKKSKKQYELLLVGSDYWMDPIIEKTINDLQMKNQVHQMGFVSDKDLVKYYRGAVALVTTTQMEGFGLPLAEAMASGCPIIAPRIAAVPEVVGKAGMVVRPESLKDMVKAMQTMCLPKKRMYYRKLGIERVKKYTWEAFAETVKRTL